MKIRRRAHPHTNGQKSNPNGHQPRMRPSAFPCDLYDHDGAVIDTVAAQDAVIAATERKRAEHLGRTATL